MLLSSALNDSKISHEEFTIITEKNIYENIKKYKRYSRAEFFRTYKRRRRKINDRAKFFRTYDIIKNNLKF